VAPTRSWLGVRFWETRMVLTGIDWLIVAAMFLLLGSSALISRAHMRSVADFLAAGRSAGRYLVAVSVGAAGLGAITIVGNLEMNFLAGFAMSWWGMTMGVVVLVATAAGWVIYRFRQTRCLTLAQFFEQRYSRRFRIFTGLIAFLSGIINMGIFPAVGARFFMYFCGFPTEVALGPLMVPVLPLLMILLLGIALAFLFLGGQVAVIAADFLQGTVLNVGLLAITLFFVLKVDWGTIGEALAQAPADQSLINPFKTSAMRDFNFWYFLIGVVGFLYSAMSWQGTQAYNASAESAHEARMAGLVGLWRGIPQTIMLAFVPIVAYTVLNHADFQSIADAVAGLLPSDQTAAVQNQLKVPLVMRMMLPPGLVGVFVAIMLAAAITTLNTYLHSWGSILVQDVIIPWRGRPLPMRAHLRALRLSILGVALFVFLFGLLFRQTQYIFLFFAITGAIFAGGSGAVIIGGLYWRRGTAAAAWTAMIVGSSISVGGIVIHQIKEDFFINGQEFWALAMGAAALAFVVVSLAGKRQVFNLDKLLHRGAYAVEGTAETPDGRRGWRRLLAGPEFSRGDRFILAANFIWTGGWFLVFVFGTVYNLTHEVADAAWMRFWRVHLWIHLALSVITVIWFTTGGFIDLGRMFRTLGSRERDLSDDGFVTREGGE
jgi:SSS family solute:Na+ symporter